MNSATTVTWQSWSEKWGNWNIWRRLGGKSRKVMTFDDLVQPRLHVAETSSSAPILDRTAKPEAISLAASAALPSPR